MFEGLPDRLCMFCCKHCKRWLRLLVDRVGLCKRDLLVRQGLCRRRDRCLNLPELGAENKLFSRHQEKNLITFSIISYKHC